MGRQRERERKYQGLLVVLFLATVSPHWKRRTRICDISFSAVHTTIQRTLNRGGDREYVYIFIYSFFAKEQGGLSAPSPSYISSPSPPPETSEVCTRGNRRFRRRAELDDRRACTRSCSSDTDSRCRLHWSRLTGRDYYKGGWRDVRIYSGQGMRRTCMLLYNSASRLAERAREIFFLILYFSPLLLLFSSFSPSTCSKTHPPNPSGLRSPFRSFLPVLQNRSFLRFHPRFTRAEIP